MISPLEYAQLASRVYSDVRGEANQPFVPAGWEDLSLHFGLMGPSASGFSASVFRKGTEIVISFAGTSPGFDENARNDWLTNITTGLGFLGEQVGESALLYERIKAAYGADGISFTGHSLGGGLASLMSVFFDKPSTTFALAPFEPAVRENNLAELVKDLADAGYADPELDHLRDAASYFPAFEELIKSRQQRISNFAINGEVLATLRFELNTLGPLPEVVNVGATQLNEWDRHGMSLHLAALGVYSFRQASMDLPSLLQLMFRQDLYGVDPRSDARTDFLERLIRYQFGGPDLPQIEMLSRFGLDAQRIARPGVASIDQVREGLIVAAIEYYNFVDVSQPADFFGRVGGGVRFDLATIDGLALDEQKGYARLRDYVTEIYGPQLSDLSLLALDTRRQWFVQAGNAGMVAASTGEIADVMLGGAAANWLDAGSGNDLLIGGATADTLTGGQGDDVLLGGAGKDSYRFRLGDGQDRIIDSDRNGRILIVDGAETRFAGGIVYRPSLSATAWSSPNGAITLSHSDSTTLSYGSGDTVDLGQGFESGNLGILLKTLSADPTPDKIIQGDLELFDGDPGASGIQPVFDPEIRENYLRDPNLPVPGLPDKLYGRIDASDRIESRGGDDTVFARGGADWVSAGDGQDRIYAGSGDDIVEGGADTDIIDGGPGDDRLYAVSKVDTAEFINATNIASAPDHDWLLGGAGDDILVGSAGDDGLMGGEGDDLILGGAGNDTIDGDANYLAHSFTWTYIDDGERPGSVIRRVTPGSGENGFTGADTVYAGDGDDFVVAGAGDDVIYGGSGQDQLAGWSGDDVLFGGTDNDEISGDGDEQLSAGDDYLDGGAGDDYLYGGGGDDYLVGGSGGDQITDESGDDTYFFAIGDGVDMLWDFEGDDRVVFGSTISTGSVSVAANGNDLVLAYGNADRITISDGFTRSVEGFETADGAYALRDFLDLKLTTAVSLASVSDISGGATLFAGAGDDTLRAGEGADTLVGGRGNDALIGNSSFTTFNFRTGDGNDLVKGAAGVKRFSFEGDVAPESIRLRRVDGTDPNHVSSRDLILSYGEGGDSIQIEDTPRSIEQTYEFADGTSLAHVQLLESSELNLEWLGNDENETVLGTKFGDVLRGQGGGDQLYGLAGDDRLEGGAGEDLLDGGSGADILEGGAGSDRLTGSSGDDTYLVSLGDGSDIIDDAQGANVIAFGSGIAPSDVKLDLVNDVDGTVYLQVRYSADDALIIAQNFGGAAAGSLSFRFDDGSVFTQGELSSLSLEAPLNYIAGDDAITVSGGRFDDQILGSPQNDSLYGGDGNDVLAGGAGADLLDGGIGDDLLVGGAGDDVMRGGAGTDTYRIGMGSGRDIVSESAGETNILRLTRGIALSDLDAVRQAANLYLHVRGARDGVILKDYFEPSGGTSQTWLLETGDGVRTDLSIMLPSLTETPRPIDISGEWETFKARVANYYRSALIADGYVPMADGRYVSDVTFGSGYRGYHTTHRVSYVGLNFETEFRDDPLMFRETPIADEQSNSTFSQSTETRRVRSMAGAVNVSYANGGNLGWFPIEGGIGSATYLSEGRSYSSDAYGEWDFGASPWQDPVTGEVSSVPYTLTFYPGTTTPPPRTIQTITRTHTEEQNSYTINVAEIHANNLANEIHAGQLRSMGLHRRIEWGGFNLVDAGAGDDLIRPGWDSPDPSLGYTLFLPDGISGTTPSGVPGSLLYGNDGDDTIFGASNDDVVIGGRGADRMFGGGGNDTYRLFAGDGQDLIFDYGASQPGVIRENEVALPDGVSRQDLRFAWQEVMVEGRYDDSGDTATSIFAALDVSWGSSDSVRIVVPHAQQNAGHGIEIFRFSDGSAMTLDDVLAIAAPETFDPQNRANVLYADADDTVLAGVDGDDKLIGGDGNDRLVGGTGRDTLEGGEGYEVLIGGKMLRKDASNRRDQGEHLAGIAELWDEGNVYRPGAGGSMIWATAGSDIYELDLGAGFNFVTDLRHEEDFFAYGGEDYRSFIGDAGAIDPAHRAALYANSDTLKFGPGIAPEQVSFDQVDAHLEITFGDRGDVVMFSEWFRAYENQLARIEHADGSLWLRNGDAFYLAYRAPTASAPSIAAPLADTQVTEDAPFELEIPASTFMDADRGDVLTYAASRQDGSVLPSWLSFDAATRTFRGTPANGDVGTIGLGVTATDSTGRSATDSFLLTVLNANDAPQLAHPIVNQSGMEGQPFTFVLPDSTFADVDVGDSLVHAARLVGGAPLPDWLAFDAAARIFTGAPALGNDGVLQIEVLATDSSGATVTTTFGLTIAFAPRNLTGTAAADTLAGAGGNDVLGGLAGNDTLQGLAGDDVLDGGVGVDSMAGGLGNDRYVVDRAGDQVIENAAEGVDTVESSINFALPANVENLLLRGSVNLNGTGNALDNILTGNAGQNALNGGDGDDTLIGADGRDALRGGAGNDTFLVNGDEGPDTFNGGAGFDTVLGGAGDDVIRVSTFSGAKTVERIDGGDGLNVIAGTAANNTIDLSETELLNIARIDAGSGNDLVTGSSGNDYIFGGDGADTLAGWGGNDVLQGGNANDTLSATTGRNLLDGGAGADRLIGGTSAEFLAGGEGNDTLSPGAGADVIAFNRGDGQDVVKAGEGTNKTVSLGGGIRYADLALRKNANDLILETGSSDRLTFKDWYASPANHSVLNLQLIAEAMADYDPGSSDPLLNRRIETFDFRALAGVFDVARAAKPATSRWGLMDSLLNAHLSGSDEAALGGDLAYQYGVSGTLAGIGVAAVQSVLGSTQFGTQAQTLQPVAVLQQDVNKLA